MFHPYSESGLPSLAWLSWSSCRSQGGRLDSSPTGVFEALVGVSPGGGSPLFFMTKVTHLQRVRPGREGRSWTRKKSNPSPSLL